VPLLLPLVLAVLAAIMAAAASFAPSGASTTASLSLPPSTPVASASASNDAKLAEEPIPNKQNELTPIEQVITTIPVPKRPERKHTWSQRNGGAAVRRLFFQPGVVADAMSSGQ